MKKNLFVLISVLFFSCTNNKVETSKINKTEVKNFIDSLHVYAKNAKFNAYFKSFSNDAVFIGTDPYENWKIEDFKTYSKPYFNKKKTWDFTSLERSIYSNKNNTVFWFDELVDSWMGVCRSSGVIELENDSLKIKQYILSVTIPNNEIKKIKKLKKQKDSLLILQKTNASKM